MNSEVTGLSVDSATGIDVSLPVAGPGARAYAFLVDWHIRLILGIAWFVVAALLYNGRFVLAPPAGNDARWFAGVLAPALAIYLLYHHVVELALRGRTPGKRLAGVQIVARDGAAPSAGALLIRNVFRLVDSLPLFYGVGLLAAMLSRDNQRIGDMAAGTLLVFEHSEARLPVSPPTATSVLDSAGAELVAELLERWESLAPDARARLARRLLARYGQDPGDLGDGAVDSWRARLLRLHDAGGRSPP